MKHGFRGHATYIEMIHSMLVAAAAQCAACATAQAKEGGEA